MTENVLPTTLPALSPSPDAPASIDAASIVSITTRLRADYEAIQNDLEQAQELAADFQQQLAGKSNEVAHFKSLLEKTQLDLTRMEGHVGELRQERHRLANEVMLLTAANRGLEALTRERDHFRREADALRTALTTSTSELQDRVNQQESDLTRLRAALDLLRAKHIAEATERLSSKSEPRTAADPLKDEAIKISFH